MYSSNYDLLSTLQYFVDTFLLTFVMIIAMIYEVNASHLDASQFIA